MLSFFLQVYNSCNLGEWQVQGRGCAREGGLYHTIITGFCYHYALMGWGPGWRGAHDFTGFGPFKSG